MPDGQLRPELAKNAILARVRIPTWRHYVRDRNLIPILGGVGN